MNLQLRRMTWWTRNEELPDLSDESEIEGDSDDEKDDDFTMKTSGLGHFLCKWGCGVDRSIKRKRLTREEQKQLQLQLSDISEDPYWKKVLDINTVICAAVAVYLHGFWA